MAYSMRDRGMDLDEVWCREYMPGPDSKALAYTAAHLDPRHLPPPQRGDV